MHVSQQQHLEDLLLLLLQLVLIHFPNLRHNHSGVGRSLDQDSADKRQEMFPHTLFSLTLTSSGCKESALGLMVVFELCVQTHRMSAGS